MCEEHWKGFLAHTEGLVGTFGCPFPLTLPSSMVHGGSKPKSTGSSLFPGPKKVAGFYFLQVPGTFAEVPGRWNALLILSEV